MDIEGNKYETIIEITNKSYFINNRVEINQGGVIWAKGLNITFKIEDSYFLRNAASSEGGAIYIEEGPKLDIKDSVFIDNESLKRGGGGAIFALVNIIYLCI